jgi:hypothetical protein
MQSSESRLSKITTTLIRRAMAPPNNAQLPLNEGDLLLAIQAIELGQFSSIREAAKRYKVPNSTLRRRMNGTRSKSDWLSPTQRLTLGEEQVLVQKVFELDSRGLPIRVQTLQDFASAITQARGSGPVGQKWSYNFIQRTPELVTRITRSLNYRRALSEDPKKIREWFDLVLAYKSKYRICDEDIYNFDETGF